MEGANKLTLTQKEFYQKYFYDKGLLLFGKQIPQYSYWKIHVFVFLLH
jgi:hypothetical protein